MSLICGHMPLLRSYPGGFGQVYKHGAPPALRWVFRQVLGQRSCLGGMIIISRRSPFGSEASATG